MYLLKVLSIFLVVLTVLPTSNGAASSKVENRGIIGGDIYIIGGEYIDIKSAPYQISIESFRKHYCGGAIISESWVLTTAYCVPTKSPLWATQIRAGTSRVLPVIEWRGYTHGIKKVISHPSYNAGAFDYDVALIQVSKVFVKSSLVQPASLPAIGLTEDRFIDYDKYGISTGWGTGQVGDHFQTWNLKSVRIPIMPRIKCGEKLESRGVKVTSRMICVLRGERGPCSGDEGGPLVHKEKLVGLFSWNARKCADPDLPSGFTNLFNEEIRSFIKTHTDL